MESSQCSNEKARGRVFVGDLFDCYGRRVPPVGLDSAVHQEIRRYFICVQPDVNYVDIHTRLENHLKARDVLSVAEFEDRAEGILEDLRRDESVKNITRGVGVPFFLPRISSGDIGRKLDQAYLKGVERSFHDLFPDHAFQNHHKGSLADKLGIVPGSRHERLVEAVRHEVVVGCYFPCLAGYSIAAAVEQMASLPDKFLLAGGFDTCAAFIGSPDLLLRTDGYPPLLWLAALSGEKKGIGYHFEAYGYNLTFNRRPHLDQAAEYWASSLVVLG